MPHSWRHLQVRRFPTGWTFVAAVRLQRQWRTHYCLFHPSTGQTAIWYFNGRSLAAAPMAQPFGRLELIDALDFNDNGRPDFLLLSQARDKLLSGIGAMRPNRGAFGPTLPTGWTLPGAADSTPTRNPTMCFFRRARDGRRFGT